MKLVSEEPGPAEREQAIKLDNECFQKARSRGQQTFTLVEQDISAPTVIAEWIKQNIETAPAGKLIDALQGAIAMRGAKVRKHAD